jgi:ribose transport system substrate-binding protein
MRRLSIGWLISILVGFTILSGCNSPRDQEKKYRIAVIPKGTSHVFWESIHAGAVKAARERGNARIRWNGPAKEDQRHRQLEIVEEFTSEGVDAIILAPTDRQTLVAPVEKALAKGIPVVIIDSGLELSDAMRNSDRYLGYVATDNHQGGVEAARRMIDLLKGEERAKVMMIRYQTGSESTEQREAGFRETIAAAANIELVVPPDEAGATVESAQQVAANLLTDRQDLDGLFVPNESSATGALRALEALNRAGDLKLVGFDANDILINALRAGKIHGLVLQDPFDMGYQSVVRVIDFLEGKGPPRERTKNTNLQVLTRENMDEPAIRPLYARDLQEFLQE